MVTFEQINADVVCPKPSIATSKCNEDGIKHLNITSYSVQRNKCQPRISRMLLHCRQRKSQRKYCKCSIIGDPHFRTFDGQSINFYGSCDYKLASSNVTNSKKGLCDFTAYVSQETRGANKHFTYIRSISVKIGNTVYTLGKNHVLTVNNLTKQLPHQTKYVRVFRSGMLVQYVNKQCGIKVAFDGDTNGFIQVSKKYSGLLNGICGDCNGIKDDFKIKGKDLTNDKDRDAKIGNYYAISKDKSCKPARNVKVENVCSKHLVNKIKSKKFCGIILTKNPFTQCSKNTNIDLKQIYEDCLVDLCGVSLRKNGVKRLRQTLCELLSGVNEECAEQSWSGIRWRSEFNCPLQCGTHQHFSSKAPPCPKTCQNHFYGTKAPCYDLPEREDCVCDKGYILDGAVCVKPNNCKCIELCADQKDRNVCSDWKKKGRCTRFKEQMNKYCPKTCGFCKSKADNCEDELSYAKCNEFMMQGKCTQSFYKSICGLTCNFEECKCKKDKNTETKCSEATESYIVTYIRYGRNENGKCVKKVMQHREPCPCVFKVSRNETKCNYCSGKYKVTEIIRKKNNGKCDVSTKIQYFKCNKCPRNERETTKCYSDQWKITKKFYHQRETCYKCVEKHKTTKKLIKCKNTTIRGKCDKTKCLRKINLTKSYVKNCKCVNESRERQEVCCCKEKYTVSKENCRKGKWIRIKTEYFFDQTSNQCKSKRTEIVRVPKCENKPRQNGKCLKTKRGLFFCKAIDTIFISQINNRCECVHKRQTRRKTCCCRPKSTSVKCNRLTGVETTLTKIYTLKRLSKSQNTCEVKPSENVNVIDGKIVTKTKTLKCNKKNCLRKILYMVYGRIGCKRAIIKRYTKSQKCCCEEISKVDTKCIRNDRIRHSTLKLVLNKKRNCVWKTASVKYTNVECQKEIVKPDLCILPNYKRYVKKVKFNVKNCRCKPFVRRYIESCPCKHFPPKFTHGSCNKYTCYRTITKKYKNNMCQLLTVASKKLCCCRQKSSKRTYCNSRNGISYHLSISWKFNESLNRCDKEERKVKISKPCKPKVKTTSKCGEYRYYYKRIKTESFYPYKPSCVCKRKIKYEFIVCDCPKKKFVSETCRETYLLKYYDIWYIDVALNRCRMKRITTKIVVECDSVPADTVKSLDRCRKQITKYKRVFVRCTCKLKEQKIIMHYCCNDKERKAEKCLRDNLLQYITTKNRPSINRLKCQPFKTNKIIRIYCTDDVIVKKLPCRGYFRKYIKYYMGVRKCKCVKINQKIITKRCKCKAIPVQKICRFKDEEIEYLKTILTLKDGKCLKSKQSYYKQIQCPKSIEKVGKCDGRLGRSQVVVTYWIINPINCKCMIQKKTSYIGCPCKKWKPKIIRNRCNAQTKKRLIIKKMYLKVKNLCQWTETARVYEICACKRMEYSETCINHYAKQIFKVGEMKVPFVTNGIRHYKCRKVKKLISSRIIRCNKSTMEPDNYCKNFQRNIISTRYTRQNCTCQKSMKVVRIEACDCHEQNHCKHDCQNGGKIKKWICFTFKAKGAVCARSSTEKIVPIEVPLPKRSCRKCVYNAYKRGYYKRCTKYDWRIVNCKPKRQIVQDNEFCYCRSKHYGPIKCRGTVHVKYLYSYVFVSSRDLCLQRSKLFKSGIGCLKERLKRTFYRCSISYKLTYYVVINCICAKKTKTRINPRCCQKVRENKWCKADSWVYSKKYQIGKLQKTHLFPSFQLVRLIQCFWKYEERSVPIKCAPSYKKYKCNWKTNNLQITYYYYAVVNCYCILRSRVEWLSSCKKCPKRQIKESPCKLYKDGHERQTITIDYYAVQSDNTCKKKRKTVLSVCRCRKSYTKEICAYGKMIYRTFNYILNTRPACRRQVNDEVEPISCYYNGRLRTPWKVVRTVKCKSPNQYSYQYLESEIFDRCKCVKKVIKKRIDICCAKCKKTTKCHRQINLKNHYDCYRSQNLKCIKYKKTKDNFIVCKDPIEEKLGNCDVRNGVQKFRVISYKLVNCKCVKQQSTISKRCKCFSKTKKYCQTDRYLIKTFHSTLRNGKCFEKITNEYEFISCNSRTKKINDSRIDDCTFERRYYKWEIQHCKCFFKMSRKLTLSYKCCQKTKVTKACIGNINKATDTTYYKLYSFQCFKNVKRTTIPVLCNKLKSPVTKQIKQCIYEKLWFRQIIRNCKCLKKLVRKERYENCCSHKKSDKSSHCNKRNGNIVTIKHTWKNIDKKRCIKTPNKSVVTVKCSHKKCTERVISKKCINNNKKIEMICYKRVNCACVPTKRTYNVCCDVDKNLKIVGKCIGYFRVDRYYMYRMMGKRCVRTLVNRMNVRCRCQPIKVNKVCFKHDQYKVTEVFYKLIPLLNICKRIYKLDYTDIPGNCQHTPYKILEELNTQCNEKTYRGYKVYLVSQAINCLCVKRKVRISVYPCMCPKPLDYERCDRNKIISYQKKPICRENYLNWKTVVIKEQIKNCSKIIKKETRCFKTGSKYPAYSYKYVTTYKMFVKNCKCDSKLLAKKREDCRCRENETIERCQGNRIVISKITRQKKGLLCVNVVKNTVNTVSCPQKPNVEQSKCSSVSKSFTIKITKFRIQNCKCIKSIKYRKCDCRCQKDSVREICSQRFFITVIRKVYRIGLDCRCFASRQETTYKPSCPKKPSMKTGPCIKKGRMGYLTIAFYRFTISNRLCLCKIIKYTIKKLCWCKPDQLTHETCHNNVHKVTQTTRVFLELSQCRRKFITETRNPTKCADDKVTKKCDKKSGIETLRTTKYQIINCKCIKKVFTEKYPCRCKGNWEEVKKFKCMGKPLCLRRIKNRKFVLLNKRCVSRYKFTAQICCCNQNETTNQYCRWNKEWWTIKITWKFNEKQNICEKQRNEFRDPTEIQCNTRDLIQVPTKCIRGLKLVHVYRRYLINCKCVKKLIKTNRCACSCSRKVWKQKQCIVTEGISVQKTETTKRYILSNCRCVLNKKVTTERKIMDCLRYFDRKIIGKCGISRSGFKKYQSVSKIWNTLIHSTCKCRKISKPFLKFCGCIKYKKVHKTCKTDKNQRSIEIIKTCKVVRIRNDCYKKCKTTQSIPPCKRNPKWNIIISHPCYNEKYRNLVMSRVYRVKCRCIEQTKRKKCHCQCNGPRQSEAKCVNRKLLRRYLYSYQWAPDKCLCMRSKFVRKTPVICRNKPSILLKGCSTIYQRASNRRFKTIKHFVLQGISSLCECIYSHKYQYKLCPCASRCTKKNECHAETQKLRTVKVCYTWQKNSCNPVTSITYHDSNCDTESESCKIISKCNIKKNLQKFKCSYRILHKCRCLPKERIKILPCKCKSNLRQLGDCSKVTCKLQIQTTQYMIKILKNGKTVCEPETETSHERCCCTDRKVTTKDSCNPSTRKLLRIKINWKFDFKRKTCNRHESTREITPKCSPKRYLKRGTKCNRRKCTRADMLIRKEINSKCKCKVSQKPIKKTCCCVSKDSKEKICDKSGKFYNITKRRYVFDRDTEQCESFVSKSIERISCPKSQTQKLGKCNGQVGSMKGQRIYYKTVKCRCVKFTETVAITCPCISSIKIVEKCDSKRGLIITQEIFYSRKGSTRCNKKILETTQRVICTSSEPKRYSVCEFNENRDKNSLYKLEKKTVSVRLGCQCEERVVEKYILCGCRLSDTEKECNGSTLVTKKYKFVQQPSSSTSNDTKCVKKVEVISRLPVWCEPPRVRTRSCDTNTKQRKFVVESWVVKECKCVKQTEIKLVRCRCENPMPNKKRCLSDNKWVITKYIRKLICDYNKPHGIPDCKCKVLSKVTLDSIVCPPPKINSECVGGWRYTKVTWYKVSLCKCTSFEYTIKKRCDEVDECEEGCCDILGEKMCKEYKKLHLCKASYLFREALCGKTCKPQLCKPNKCKTKKPLIKKISNCECKTIGTFEKLCTYKVQVITWKLIKEGRNNKCSKVESVKKVPCFCIDNRPLKECTKLKLAGKCSSDKKVKEECAATCRPELCSYCSFTGEQKFKQCVQFGREKGKYLHTVIRFSGLKRSKLCFVEINESYRGLCKTCDIGKREKTVESCAYSTDGGKYQRSIVLRYVIKKFGTNECENKIKVTKESCQDCCPSTETLVGGCIGKRDKKERKVTTIYWANERGCCRKKTVVNTYDCSAKCASDSKARIVRSKCFPNNQRIVTKTFYSGKISEEECEAHTVYDSENCSSTFF